MTLEVLESALDWLPFTQSWLHTQLTSLPRDVRWSVVCETRSNRLRFRGGRVRTRLTGSDDEEGGWFERLDRRTAFVARRRQAVGAQVIHSHFGNVGWRDLRVVAAAAPDAVGHVVSFYGHDVVRLPTQQPKWRPRYQELFAQADRFLVEGPHMALLLAEQGAPAARIQVHHLGVDVARIPFTPRALAPGDPVRVLMAGRFVEKKGFPDGLRALALVGRRTPLQVTLVGDVDGADRSDDEKRAILQALTEPGLEGRVRLAGFVSPRVLRGLAREHHVLFAPSRTAQDGDTEGGCPMTVPELGAMGPTVVSTSHADLPMLVHEGETGFVAAERDVAGLAAALDRAIDARRRGHAHAQAFRSLVETDFDARKQGQRLAAVYHEVAP